MGRPQELPAALAAALVVALAAAQCPSTSFVDPEPASSVAPPVAAPWAPNPAPFPGLRSPIILPHNASEIVYLPIQDIPSDDELTQRTNCPHLDSGLSLWHDPATWPNGIVPTDSGTEVWLPAGKRVLISSCSVPADTIFSYIHVVPTSALIFADANISLSAYGIMVHNNASLLMGSATCRLRSYVTLTFYGTRPRPTVITDTVEWEKGISSSGRLEMHGARYASTWSRLASDVQPGDRWIFIQERVNWEPGQIVLLTTTAMKDARDYHENETFNITRIFRVGAPGSVLENATAVEVDRPVRFRHYAGPEYQAELALMSRRIVVRGAANDSEPTDNWPVVCYDKSYTGGYPCSNTFRTGYGAQIRVMGTEAVGRIAGVMCHRCGQTNVLGHYPFHFHMMGATNASYLTDSSVYVSYFRCVAVHAINGLRVLHNTAYNVIGFCYYLEEGVEERNIFINNLVAHVHYLGPYPAGDYNLTALSPSAPGSSFMPDVAESEWLKLPADISASGFYITNANNYFVGNSAVGGWSGYAFPNLPKPIGLSRNVNMSPYTRPQWKFDGNSARSSAFLWGSTGCIYFGAWLAYDPVNTSMLVYNPGRFSRPSPSDGQPNLLTNTKMSLCNNLGLMHWGNKPQIDKWEIHDSFKGFTIFGVATASNGLIKCRSGNLPNPRTFGGYIEKKFYTASRNVFQWYDVGQQHIMYNISFRNCTKAATGVTISAFQLLTHSDEFVPEFMQASGLINYEGLDYNASMVPTVTKPTYPVNHSTSVTLSGRLQSWWDFDGSASRRGKPTLLGSSMARDWWRLDNQCGWFPQWSMWGCDKTPSRGSASFYITYDYERQRWVGSTALGAAARNCSNGAVSGIYLPCERVGQMTHVGRNFSSGLDLAINTKVTGPTGGYGWVTYFNEGAPKNFNITNIQVNATERLYFVMQYPLGTKFSIQHRISSETCSSSCKPTNKPLGCLCAAFYRQVATREEVWAGRGDEYAFVDGFLYFRVTAQNPSNIGYNGTWGVPDITPAVSRFGLSVTGKVFGSKLVVRSDCQTYDDAGLYCKLDDPLRVPPGPCKPDETQTGIDICQPSATPTPSMTSTGSATASNTPSNTATATLSSSQTVTGSSTATMTATATATLTSTASGSGTRTAKPTTSPTTSASGTTTSRPAGAGVAVVTVESTVRIGLDSAAALASNLPSLRANLSSDAVELQRAGEALCAALVATVTRLARFPTPRIGATASPSTGAAALAPAVTANVRCGGVRYVGTPVSGSRRLQAAGPAATCNPLTADPSAGCVLTALELVISVVDTVAAADSSTSPTAYAAAVDAALASWTWVRSGMVTELSALAGQESSTALLTAGSLSAPAPATANILAPLPASPAPVGGGGGGGGSDSGLSAATIGGAVAGGLAVVVAAGACFTYFQRRRRARSGRGPVSGAPVSHGKGGPAWSEPADGKARPRSMTGRMFTGSRASFAPERTTVNPGAGNASVLRSAASGNGRSNKGIGAVGVGGSSRGVGGGGVSDVLSAVPAVMTRDSDGRLLEVSARDRTISGRITSPYAAVGRNPAAAAARMSAVPVAVAGDGSSGAYGYGYAAGAPGSSAFDEEGAHQHDDDGMVLGAVLQGGVDSPASPPMSSRSGSARTERASLVAHAQSQGYGQGPASPGGASTGTGRSSIAAGMFSGAGPSADIRGTPAARAARASRRSTAAQYAAGAASSPRDKGSFV